MKLLRNKFIHRSISIFLLIVFIQPIFSPYYTFALTSGRHQPEFTSYEAAGSTDMVNLMTGDFGFNIPILEVPGPEGSFSLPLSYHAGIGSEQEASWVGLGWNIDAGAILRNINQYPDDSNGEPNYVSVKDLTGVNGWNRTFNHPFKDDWNSQTGYHGNVNLLDIIEVDFGNETSVGIVGVHVGDNGVTFDPVQFVNAAMTILSYGTSGVTSFSSIAKQAAIDLTISTAISFAMPVNTPGAATGGRWSYNKSDPGSTKINNHWKASLASSILFTFPLPIFSKEKSWKYWLDETRRDDMYGVLYMGKERIVTANYGSTINNVSSSVYTFDSKVNQTGPNIGLEGVATDVNFTAQGGQTYSQQNPATVLALDDYTVNAGGISGSIKPLRLEIGSVSMPRNMAANYSKDLVVPFLSDYKVPFTYVGSSSNQYYYHTGNNGSDPSSFNYGMNYTIGGTPRYTLNDYIFSTNQRIRNDVDINKRKVPQGNNVQWTRNGDLDGNYNWLVGHVDFLSNVYNGSNPSDRYNFRNNHVSTFTNTFATSMTSFATNIPVNDKSFLDLLTVGNTIKLQVILASPSAPATFNCTITAKNDLSLTVSTAAGMSTYLNAPQDILLTNPMPFPDISNTLGAYNITSADGTTFHFALPVYGYDERSESILKSDNSVRSLITRYAPFASTWLLTAITGSDFVDRNNNGIPDEGDWGYWVKMNYGKYSDGYAWRVPYTGTMDDPEGKFTGYEKGQKQLYYLNSIETRSHIALFMKSDRGDAMDAYKITPPQKLDEICLLKKEHYEKLKQAPYNIPNFSNTVLQNCLSSQFTGNARDYVNKNCLKRVLFNYSYDLCKNTPNTLTTINPLKGKLTLLGISIKGRNDLKVVPDYKFEYNNNNPNYGTNLWDGWGMYNSNGTAAVSSHSTSDPTGNDGSVWSLTKVTTPLGSDMIINYERDTYSSISGEVLLGPVQSFNNTNYTEYCFPGNLFSTITLPNTSNYVSGDKVRISGDVSYKCPNSAVYVRPPHYSGDYVVSAVSPTTITLASDYLGINSCGGNVTGITNFEYNTGTIQKIEANKKGGNIRVGSIVMRDEFGKENKLRYLYKDAIDNSSGVVSQEPDYIKPTTLPANLGFYEYLRYPQTPVMYGVVSVLSGKLTNDADFYSKQVFEFETPHTSQFFYQMTDQGSTTNINKKLFTIQDKTSKIGKLKSIQIRDALDNVVSQSQLIYTPDILNEGVNNHQGYFAEGTLLTDFTSDVNGWSQKLIRTTVVTSPYALKKIINSKDGFSSTTENLSWDPFTGVPNQRLDKSSLGIYVKTVTKPAYTFYPELRSSAYNVYVNGNPPSVITKNMLLQNAATYVYRSDALGASLGLISAEAQTWRNDWANYRKHNGTDYVDEGVQSNKVWRKGPAYSWKGSYDRLYDKLQVDYGTQNFSASDEFNFSGANPGWQYLGENTRFDHYGMPLEGVGFNGPNNTKSIYGSVKMGYGDRIVVSRATNAKYNEIAFSSAEDKIAGMSYFGGEVGLGANGSVVNGPVHTGNSALYVTASGYGFVFKSTELSTTKQYKASVWMSSSGTGTFYYKGADGVEVVPQSQTVSSPVVMNGNESWQRIDLIFTPPSSTLEIGVKTSRTFGVFDDFRFQPVDAVMTCNVYPPLDFEFTATSPTYSSFSYVLDNDNLFTKYEVNEKGELIKVYRESIQYGVKLISESKSNLRRFNVNQ
ncbi:MAG: hypothetical protein ABI663_03430 [Chryseolinea sp.]